MQFAHAFRALAPESAAQEIGEEVVVTVPEPLFVQPQDEEVLPVQPLHVVPVGAAGEASHKEPVRLLRIEVEQKFPCVSGLTFEPPRPESPGRPGGCRRRTR